MNALIAAVALASTVEISAEPVIVQLNPRYIHRYAAGALASVRVGDGIAMQARFQHRLFSPLTEEGAIIAGSRTEEMKPTFPSPRWSLLIGPELHPFRGSGTVLDAPAAFAVAVRVGAGLRDMQELSINHAEGFVWFDTGLRFAAGAAIGPRMTVGRFVVRLELAYELAAATPNTVQGCTVDELASFDRKLREGSREIGPASAGCDVAYFREHLRRIPEAFSIAAGPSGPLPVVNLHLGLGVAL